MLVGSLGTIEVTSSDLKTDTGEEVPNFTVTVRIASSLSHCRMWL